MKKYIASLIAIFVIVGNTLIFSDELDFSSVIFSENMTEGLSQENELISFRIVLAPRDIAILSAQVSSVVEIITRNMGESFNDEELLIQLDSTIYQAEKTKSQALVEQGRAKLTAQEELFRDNVASTLELKEAQAELATAQAELTITTKRVEACGIVGPYQGRVARLMVHEHEMVQPGQELIEVVDDKVLLAKLLIPSRFFNHLTLGEEIVIQVEETGVPVSGKISHIGSVIDPASSMIQIFAEVQNKEGKLRAGMVGQTQLIDKNIQPDVDESVLTEEDAWWNETESKSNTY